jgi:hypothetical protein
MTTTNLPTQTYHYFEGRSKANEAKKKDDESQTETSGKD